MNIDRPILLFGMPRSGTTWIGKIFDSHPQTVYRHEPDTFQPLPDIPILADPELADTAAERLREYLSQVVEMRAERVCAKQPIFPKSYLSSGGTSVYRVGTLASKAAGRMGVALPVLGAPRLDDGRQWRLVWKSIESLGRLGLLLRAYTDAVSIQILRHPCGFVGSVLRGEADQRFKYGGAAEDFGIFSMLCQTTQALRRGLTLADFQTMHPTERLAWRWVLFNEKAAEDAGFSGRSHTLGYEELCANPRRVTRQMFDWAALSWDEQTGTFLDQSTGNVKSDYYSVFKNPMESAWKWRREMQPQDIERVMRVVAGSSFADRYAATGDEFMASKGSRMEKQ